MIPIPRDARPHPTIMDIPESDWKVFRTVRAEALERYCARVLDECAVAIADRSGSEHDLYIRLYRLLKERDHTLADAFDDFRRSTAIFQLAIIHRHGLVTGEELGRFSTDTRELVTGMWR